MLHFVQVALNWCMQQGTIPIPGARNLNQARQNLGALGWRLSSGCLTASGCALLNESCPALEWVRASTPACGLQAAAHTHDDFLQALHHLCVMW